MGLLDFFWQKKYSVTLSSVSKKLKISEDSIISILRVAGFEVFNMPFILLNEKHLEIIMGLVMITKLATKPVRADMLVANYQTMQPKPVRADMSVDALEVNHIIINIYVRQVAYNDFSFANNMSYLSTF